MPDTSGPSAVWPWTPWRGLGLLAPFPALHALMAGASGVFTLHMMAPVTLGHPRRVVEPSAGATLAFVLITAAPLARVLPLIAPVGHPTWLLISRVLWMAIFGVFLGHANPAA